MTDPTPPNPDPTPEPLQLDANTRARLERHLDAVEDVLRRYAQHRATRSAILDELENQILDKLTQQAADNTPPTATLDELHAVLAEMDPPEAYARNSIDLPAPSPFGFPDAPPPKLNRATLLGLLWIAWFALAAMALIFLYTTVAQPAIYPPEVGLRYGPRPDPITPTIYAYQTWWGSLLIVLLCFPGLLAPIATTGLGWIGLKQIQASNGREHGQALAKASAWFFPIAVGNLILLAILSAPIMVLGVLGSQVTATRHEITLLGVAFVLAVLALYAAYRINQRVITRLCNA
ncbi:MAG: hypothetical protein AAF750_06810 [Planctomycetota bacterium]